MPKVHILQHCVTAGDAVSNDVLAMLRWFRGKGLSARVFAGRCKRPGLGGEVRPLGEYEAHLRNPADVLIYHHSVGWPDGLDLYQRSRNRKVLRYHNVTPPRYFRPYNAVATTSCVLGLKEVPWLVREDPEVILPASAFNAKSLVAAGARAASCHVVPPLHPIGELDPLPLDERLAARLRGRTNLLFVGRLAPHKGHRHLIRALAYYYRYYVRRAHLILVGGCDPELADYREDLRREVRRQRLLGLVHFAGKVSPRRLKTYYTHASAFVCTSEHEGFCVPLVEAMYYRIPIVAYGSSGISLTLGDAGLVWPTPEPALFAESIREIEDNPGTREALVEGQWRRFQSHFTSQAITRRLEEALGPLLPDLRTGPESHPSTSSFGPAHDQRPLQIPGGHFRHRAIAEH
jgi:glycosyltransferase involved in cell wall biosynthesis